MPMVIRNHFPNCIVIIDCFENFRERPTNLLSSPDIFTIPASQNCQVSYWNHPTRDSELYSERWGGRTSDKYLTEHCSLLNHLVPRHTVLADRGFYIMDSMGSCCTLKISTFTKGKKQHRKKRLFLQPLQSQPLLLSGPTQVSIVFHHDPR